MAHYNQDAWRMVEEAVAKFIKVADADPAEGTKGQIVVVDGTVKVCTVASDGDTAATWKEIATK